MSVLPEEFQLSSTGRELIADAVAKFLLGIVLLFALFPIWMMIITSFNERSQLLQSGVTLIPTTFHVENYINMWNRFPLVDYFLNSLIISGATTVICLLVASLAAYSFSRYDFPGKDLFGLTILSTQMIPGVLILIPMFMMFITIQERLMIDMVNTYHGIIFIYSTFTVPFAIWMLRGYFDTIPTALEEAARIDGCTRTQALFYIVLPLALPGIAATGMFVFIIAFNEVLFASVMASDNVTPFAIGIQEFNTNTRTYWTEMMAAATVSSVPLLLIFVLFQRQIVSGLTAGGVKQ
ncbi:carbohydrate ABC transporter permease [Halocatena salina]|uniref:Carbohydrate ABC transporter permease n=1 Tax=Halocatena salina TaxID=2934340 RepID=A0A8U0A1M5_9EURY|nr:carbohydrate ABC transporter permease [Halocatena salina]UPM42974.1 carbohydrate ABC transporter permease [Halocatena salina]